MNIILGGTSASCTVTGVSDLDDCAEDAALLLALDPLDPLLQAATAMERAAAAAMAAPARRRPRLLRLILTASASCIKATFLPAGN